MDCRHVLLLGKGKPGHSPVGSARLLPPSIQPRPLTLLHLHLHPASAGLRPDLVLTGRRWGTCFRRVGVTVGPTPEPGVVCVLQQPAGQPVLQHLLITLRVGLPFGIFEFLHVLRADPLGHHLELESNQTEGKSGKNKMCIIAYKSTVLDDKITLGANTSYGAFSVRRSL